MMTNNEVNKYGVVAGHMKKVSDDSTKATAVCICRFLVILAQLK